MKKLLIVLLSLFLLSSCGFVDKEELVSKVKLGMSKQDVIELAGTEPVDIDYRGDSRHICMHFYDGLNGNISFVFVDNKLTEFRSY